MNPYAMKVFPKPNVLYNHKNKGCVIAPPNKPMVIIKLLAVPIWCEGIHCVANRKAVNKQKACNNPCTKRMATKA